MSIHPNLHDYDLLLYINDLDIDKIDPNQWINNPWFDAYLEDEYDDHLDMVEGDIEESIKRAMEWLYANDL